MSCGRSTILVLLRIALYVYSAAASRIFVWCEDQLLQEEEKGIAHARTFDRLDDVPRELPWRRIPCPPRVFRGEHFQKSVDVVGSMVRGTRLTAYHRRRHLR
jgi:hypothetical protein